MSPELENYDAPEFAAASASATSAKLFLDFRLKSNFKWDKNSNRTCRFVYNLKIEIQIRRSRKIKRFSSENPKNKARGIVKHLQWFEPWLYVRQELYKKMW